MANIDDEQGWSKAGVIAFAAAVGLGIALLVLAFWILCNAR